MLSSSQLISKQLYAYHLAETLGIAAENLSGAQSAGQTLAEIAAAQVSSWPMVPSPKSRPTPCWQP
jgi:hypothetical protein